MTGAGCGNFFGDPLDQRHPPEAGQHDLRALLLRHTGHRERYRSVGDHPGDQQPLAVEKSHQIPIPRPPSTGSTTPLM